MLRSIELGLSTEDLRHITVGLVFDLFKEKGKDTGTVNTVRKATQADWDNF